MGEMDKTKLKEYLLGKLGSDIAKDMKKSMDEEELILFVSFDLVNSSSYKTRNYTSWFPILITINEKIKEYMLNKIKFSQLWRSIGDEAIFIVNITSLKQLEESVQTIFEILNDVIEEIKDGSILKDVFKENEINVFVAQNVLSLKAGAWIAPVHKTSDLTKKTTHIHNLMYMYNHDEGLPTYEFQGNDIDTGFRVLKNTREKRLVLSIELAYLLSKNQNIDPKINIITYRKLKGIWDGKLYPVIWYHDDEYAKCKLEDSFSYDDYYTDDLIKELIDKEYEFIKVNNKNTSFQKLDKIIKDKNITSKIKLLEDKIYELDTTKKLIEGNKLLEVHCVAVCYNKIKNKVLMFKRGSHLDNFANRWEFGCSVIGNGMTFKENLEKDYKKFAGIEISVKYPFKEYSFEDENGKTIPGIRFIAEFADTREECELELDSKYSEVRYVDLNNYKGKEFENNSIHYNEFLDILKYVFENNKEYAKDE